MVAQRKKNVCALESSLVLIEIYTKSFGGKNLACAIDFLPSEVEYVFFSMPDAVQIRRIFFPLGIPSRLLLKAHIFLILCW